MSIATVIVAAGRGTRAGADPASGLAKQWRAVAGARVIDHSIAAFQNHPQVRDIVLVLHRDDVAQWADAPGVTVAIGGADRAASVRAGLAALAPDITCVLIHDVARPCVSDRIISDVIAALEYAPAAAPAMPVTDALWRGENGRVSGTQDRTDLFRAQTPQGFHRCDIEQAHAAHKGGAADDVEVARAAGISVTIVSGDDDNIKITTSGDFARAAYILNRQNHQDKDIQ